MRRRLSPGCRRRRAVNCREPRTHDRNERSRHAIRIRRGIQKEKTGFCRFHVRSLRQKRQSAVSRRRRLSTRTDQQGPLELCGVESARRISRSFVLEREKTAGGDCAVIQYGWAEADGPLRNGAA